MSKSITQGMAYQQFLIMKYAEAALDDVSDVG